MGLVLFFNVSILVFFFQLSYGWAFDIDPYLIKDGHPAKVELDRIFSESRAIFNIDTMLKAGFINPYPRKFTRLVVTKHPALKGYVIKAYLDAQRYYKRQPEILYWTLRIQGAEAIRSLIEKNQWQDRFKVPHKWIYPLPETPVPPRDYLCKHYILVEEDMDLMPQEINKRLWAGEGVSRDLLLSLFSLLEELGLHDCAGIDNIPFSKDGRIAFIDTQSFDIWPVHYAKLKPSLSKEMKGYWDQITASHKR